MRDRDSNVPRKLCVLLLEDDDADAYLTRRALASLPQVDQVVRAKNGQEALDLLTSGRVAPDIAFVDLQMPTVDGHEFMTACSDQRLANVPMVVLTSSSVMRDAVRSRVLGALRVVTKMEDPAELRQALAEAIEAFTGPAPPLYPQETRTAWPALSTALVGEARAPRAAPASPSFGRRTARGLT